MHLIVTCALRNFVQRANSRVCAMTEMESVVEPKWTHARKVVLLKAKFQNEQEFRSKPRKSALVWEKVLRDIKQIDKDFPFSSEEIAKKFLNMMITYKRIKKRYRTSAEAATSWEYFEAIDEVYGNDRHKAPADSAIDSTDNGDQFLTGGCDDLFFTDSKVEPETDANKTTHNELMEFLKSESKGDQQILKEFLAIEREKLNVEREKVQEIRKLRELLFQIAKYKSAK